MKHIINRAKLSFVPAVARLLGCIAVTCVGFVCQPLTPASAQDSSQSDMRQEDIDRDGQLDLTVIEAMLETSKDEVLVYDGAHNMRPSNDWHTATDFEDDTWIFDSTSDGSAQLIIKFARIGATLTATLFTDQNGDGTVEYKMDGIKIVVTEPFYPPLMVTAQGDWFLPNGQLNWNVRFQTDGSSIVHLHTYDLSDIWNRGQYLRADGKPDIELEFRDQDRDGIPEYGIWRIVVPTPGDVGSARTWIWANEGRNRPMQPTGFLFWPYLITDVPTSPVVDNAARPQGLNYFDAPPIISMNFNAARVQLLAFSGYPIEQGFHVNTLQPFQKDILNYADFENAQAYYDIADDRDGYPELHVRHRYYAPDDSYGWNLNTPVNEIRWSWNQSNAPALNWDYKLGLAGRHTITTEVQLMDFRYATVPYRDLPRWVTTNRWDYATLVARETASFQSTEGIYRWGPIETLVNGSQETTSQYLAGNVVVDLRETFQNIDVGWRAEFVPHLQARPHLYFSAIDRKLHLLKLSHGVWQINDQDQVRFSNLDGDAYADQWSYLEDGQLRRQLTFTPNHLIYAGDNQVRLKQVHVKPALFETLPPRDHVEWLALDQQLKANHLDFGPSDFKAMMNQYDGPEIEITGANLRDYRLVGEKGFRFVLSLQPGLKVSGNDLLGIRNLSPGDYAVTYDGAFRTEPLTPPAISASLTNTVLNQLEQSPIQVQLRNDGLQDLPTATLEVWATSPYGKATMIVTQTVSLLAQTPMTPALQWVPPTPGTWTLTPRIRLPNGQSIEFSAAQVMVLPVQVVGPEALLTTGGALGTLPFAGLGLVTFAIIAALIFWQQFTTSSRGQVDDAT